METNLGIFLSSLLENSQDSAHIIAWLFYLLLFMIVVDIITGFCKGFYQGRLDSAKNHQGYVRKATLIIVAISAVLLDLVVSYVLVTLGLEDFTMMGINLVVWPILSGLTLVWVILGELLSILENLGAIGITLPKFIEEGLNRLHSNLDEGNIDIKSKVSKDEEGNTIVENKMKVPKPKATEKKREEDE